MKYNYELKHVWVNHQLVLELNYSENDENWTTEYPDSFEDALDRMRELEE